MTKKRPQIIALGGGGFSMEPDNLALDRYILQQTGKKRPKVCFVPTASADSADYIRRFEQSFASLECETSVLTLFPPPCADLESFVMKHDVIYVGGGNTKNLIALWRAWNLDRIFRKAWRSGIVLCGISAGSLCWFEHGVTDSIPGPLTAVECLGFLKGSNCVHYDGEVTRRPRYHLLLKEKKLSNGYAADDGVALHYVGRKLHSIISSRANAAAYRVTYRDKRVVETTIKPHILGNETELSR